MGRNFIEKRIIKAGVRLCKDRLKRKGPPITEEDIKDLKVSVMSPYLRSFYVLVGSFFIVFGIWAQHEMGMMIVSFTLALMGFANIGFAAYGRPCKVSELGKDIDVMSLTADITQTFVKEMDSEKQTQL